MAGSTPNLAFSTIDPSDRVGSSIEAIDANFTRIDGMPIPIESGSNSQLKYMKYNDGTAHIWGKVSHTASQYPCTALWGSGFYSSISFTVNYPLALTKTDSFSLQVIASVNPDMWCLPQTLGTTSLMAVYVCGISETNNRKDLYVDIWGMWK